MYGLVTLQNPSPAPESQLAMQSAHPLRGGSPSEQCTERCFYLGNNPTTEPGDTLAGMSSPLHSALTGLE